MASYYNEIDPHAAQWLRNLIAEGLIAPGDVDERDIREVRPDDLRKYTQRHFFAGIGAWSYALRLAGWEDDRPVWTGSCPCQSFSNAGQRKGPNDERHLWPSWLPLIRECRPPTLFGEQVEAAISWAWLDTVLLDLEDEGYACGSAVLPVASVGAPHIRNRIWFVADADATGQREFGRGGLLDGEREAQWHDPDRCGDAGGLGDAHVQRLQERECDGRIQREALGPSKGQAFIGRSDTGFWSDAEWLHCTDGKSRPIESSSFPLVDGASFKLGSGSPFEGKSRAKMLKGYGNAIVAPLAAEFIAAFMEI